MNFVVRSSGEQKQSKETCAPDLTKPRRSVRGTRTNANKLGADELRDHWEQMQVEMKIFIQRIEKEYNLKLQKAEEQIHSLCERLKTEEHRCRYLAQTIIEVLPIIEYAAEQRPLPLEVKQTAMVVWHYLGTEAECCHRKREEEVLPPTGSSPITGLLRLPTACQCTSPKGFKKDSAKAAIDAEVASYIWSVKASLRASVNRSTGSNGVACCRSDSHNQLHAGLGSRSSTGHFCMPTKATESVGEVGAQCSLESEGEASKFKGLRLGMAEDPERIKTPTFGRGSSPFFADYWPGERHDIEGDELCTKCREILDHNCGTVENRRAAEQLWKGDPTMMRRKLSDRSAALSADMDGFMYDKECGSDVCLSRGRCQPPNNEAGVFSRERVSSVQCPCHFQHALTEVPARWQEQAVSGTKFGGNGGPAPGQLNAPEDDANCPLIISRGKSSDMHWQPDKPGLTSLEPNAEQGRTETECSYASFSPSSPSWRFSSLGSSRLASTPVWGRPSGSPSATCVPGLETLLSEGWSHSRDAGGNGDRLGQRCNRDRRDDTQGVMGKSDCKDSHEAAECLSDSDLPVSQANGMLSPTHMTAEEESWHSNSSVTDAGNANGTLSPTHMTAEEEESWHSNSSLADAGNASGAANWTPGTFSAACTEPVRVRRLEQGKEHGRIFMPGTEQASEEVRCKVHGRWSDRRVCIRQWHGPASLAWGLDCRGILGEDPVEGLPTGLCQQPKQRMQGQSQSHSDDQRNEMDVVAAGPETSGRPWLVGKLIGGLASVLPPLWETRMPTTSSEKLDNNDNAAGGASTLKKSADGDVQSRIVGGDTHNGLISSQSRRPSSSDIFPLRQREGSAVYHSSWAMKTSCEDPRGGCKKSPSMPGYGPSQWWIACSLWCFSCLGFIFMTLLHDCRIRVVLL